MKDPHFAPVMEATRRAGTPAGQPVPSIEHNGRRVRIVRNRLYFRPPKETFHEFLLRLLQWTLGEPWYKGQQKRPFEQRHQILKWYKAANDCMKAAAKNPPYRDGDLYGIDPTGDLQSLTALAYDVYHLLHRGELPNDVLKRLKDKSQFQGARYEITVAAMFVRAEFTIKFLSYKSKKHPEFIATDTATKVGVAVEAKSRHRPGILDFAGPLDDVRAVRGDVEELINEALGQNPGDSPFMIFVDLNVPLKPGSRVQQREWYKDVWASMQTLKAATPERPDEFNGIFLTNYSYHTQGPQKATGGEYLWILPTLSRHPLPAELVGRICAAVANYGSIPREI